MTDFGPRRILMTGDTVGGVWTFTLELAGQLTAFGAEVLLVTFGGAPTAEQRRRADAISGLRLWYSDLKLEWMDDPWEEVEASRSLLWEVAREFQPEIAHLNTYAHATLPWDCPVIVTAHSCVLSWWEAVNRTALPQTWHRYRDEVREALVAADLITAPSAAMLGALKKHYGLELHRATVVFNGITAENFHQQQKEPFILTAGRLWDQAKNVQALRTIGSRLRWPVCLAGAFHDAKEDDPETSNCRFLGPLPAESLADWYSRAAIYALPARYEPFGLSALEAAVSGCALVLGDIPSLRELWDGAAVFVPPEEPDRLLNALDQLIDDDNLRAEAARRCQKRAASFTASRMGSAYMEAFRSVASGRVACAS